MHNVEDSYQVLGHLWMTSIACEAALKRCSLYGGSTTFIRALHLPTLGRMGLIVEVEIFDAGKIGFL